MSIQMKNGAIHFEKGNDLMLVEVYDPELI